MRLIDADALLDRVEWANTNPLLNHGEIAVELIKAAPTIEPERTGRWIKVGHIENTYLVSKCSVCGYQTIDAGNYCTNCGAYMYNTVEIARDIVHQAIDNTVWLDTVDIAKMHKAVDDKYVEMEVEHEQY